MTAACRTQYAFRSLAPGDPWTMILDAPILTEAGEPMAVGEIISKWFATNEPGRLFQITRVHGSTYEIVFVGFEPQPCVVDE
ncbi:hypothetical protein ACQR1I_35985 [Bradyrhizobium sp. HKCCYLS2038]|uniref:hypothetical protein n=1 Tax=Bradyrhizobium sp. HKCCYLS2038 TaxID=3420764 RepID=UPI003EBA609E